MWQMMGFQTDLEAGVEQIGAEGEVNSLGGDAATQTASSK